MTPQEFVNKWANTVLNEIQVAQAHFLDVCLLAGIDMPGGAGKTARGETFVFEQSLSQAGGSGFADVFFENHFGVEYKSPDKYKNLSAAYEQLQRYRENLKNPPLLVVTDINHWEIHTNFPNTEKRVYRFSHNEIATNSEVLGWLRAMFHAPERLHPGRNTDQVTKEAADAFQLIADNMRDWNAEPTRIAYFLTKLVFCLFAEDVGLLPTASSDSPQGIFSYIIQESRGKPNVFKQYVQNLFVAMNEGDNFLMREIPYFNGTLFKVLTVETLQVNALNELAKAAELNWASIEPSIFGTLFERSLDPAKRSQLGAHYTSRDDILLIVEPVLMQPLRAEWEAIQAEAAPIRERFDSAATVRARTSARKRLLALRERILKRVRETTVLDPACGSGNFLYVSLQLLMDLEKAIIQHSLWAGLQMATREVHPRQMYGIELNPIAQALASIVVWIGYIQWRMNNGYGQEFGQPILEELEDNIVCKDAILSFDDEGSAIEPEWPAIDVVVGNPPFLGDKLMRGELGDDYVGKLRNLYQGRVPGGADLVTYWFEKAREEIEIGRVKRAGLLSTNSIRIGTNRAVLSSIKSTGDIFMAWSDREWPLEGANVRVSMIGFDDGTERSKTLDGIEVQTINSDLTASVDIADATPLNENANLSFLGVLKTGPFEISENRALAMIKNNEHNRAVIKPRLNGRDLVNVPSNKWIIDFLDMSENEALQFKEPYDYVKEVVKPVRNRNKVSNLREKWWQHARPRYAMRTATKLLTRFIATPEVTKHRIFGWVEKGIVPDHTLHVIARDDDYFMGILHSHIHILWAIRMGA